MTTSPARALADVSTGIILADIEINAPPERVFTALTSAEITQWWGDDDTYKTTAWHSDLRPGGHWKATGMGADGLAFSVQGEYLSIEPARRIVQTWRPDWDDGQTTTVTYSLTPTPQGTRLTVRHEGFTTEQAASCESHAQGWELVLNWLQRWAKPSPDTAAPLHFLLRLIPPRPSFAVDMTPQEQATMATHAEYWSAHLATGQAILFGPVLDPAGVWGLLALEVRSEQELNALKDADPALAGIPGMRWEVMPFLTAMARPHAA